MDIILSQYLLLQTNMTYYCDNQRHLVCIPYSIDNLHKMADTLNIKRCWYHNSKFPHYDVPKKRIQEIKEKCIVVSARDILNICKHNKI